MRGFVFALAALPLLLAAGAVPASAAASAARVRLVYVSPDRLLGHIDFYIDNRKVVSNTDYNLESTYSSLATGQHTFAVRKAGADPSSTPETQVQQSLDAGYWSVFVGGKVGSPTCPIKSVIFSDDIAAPPAGKVAARFVHMAPEVPGVDVVTDDVNRTPLFKNVACFQASQYSTFPAGNYGVALVATGTDNRLFGTEARMPSAGVVWTLVGAGGVDYPVSLIQVPDAASAGSVPHGAAATGEGGAALREMLPLGLIASSLLACALLLLFVRRSAA
jgi:Domain of unknown function (DUF4397)